MREVREVIWILLASFAALFAVSGAEKDEPVQGSGCDPMIEECVGENALGMMDPGG